MDKGFFQAEYDVILPVTYNNLFILQISETDMKAPEGEVVICFPHSLLIHRYSSTTQEVPNMIAKYGQENFLKMPSLRAFMHVWDKRKFLYNFLQAVPEGEMTEEMENTLQQHIDQIGRE